MKHEKLYVSGMTCTNCQTRIASALNARSGITEISVSYETDTAEFSYDPSKISLEQIIEIIGNLGYEASAQNISKKKVILNTVREIAIIAVLFLLLQRFGILNRLVPDSLADSEMGYGMLFVIGLITSSIALPCAAESTCLRHYGKIRRQKFQEPCSEIPWNITPGV